MKENLKLVLVGHIDHGKSTLIGRLFHDTDSLPQDKLDDIRQSAEKRGQEVEFAHVMDHLKEERDQGITIDTAQTFFTTDTRDYVIIDAPGHKEFIKNMITGASQAEAGILVLDADEGVMPQTKRHAYILSMLGIDQVIVALNKMDKVGYSEERFREVKENVLEFLDRIGIDPSYVVPISAKQGDTVADTSENMDWYDGITILDALDTFEATPAPTEKPLRFPVQDTYEIDGREVVVGRVESGVIEEGKSYTLLPGGKEVRVKEILKYKEDTKKAGAGESIGLILDTDGLERGNVVSDTENPPKGLKKPDVNLFWLSPKEIKINEPMTFRCATQEVESVISKIKKRIDSSTLEVIQEDADKLEEHEVGEVEFELDKPVFLDSFNDIKEMGRFVIERNENINGGGIILEA